MLDEVTAALAAIEAEGAFATELGCGSDDLHIEVEGVGPIRFPISVATARKLCAVARPAPFGRRDATVHDVSVRDTWEIGRSRIKIDTRRWRRTLDPELATIRQRLGLPEGGKLEAALDKMLVYGPGQFFAPHQDSERADDMVGSLVVELPSRHEGGAIVVQHHREKKVFRGAARGPEENVDRNLDDLLALLETAAVIRAPVIRDDIIAFLTAPETRLPLMTAGALLQKCREGRTPAAVRELGLQTLYRHVVALLERALAAKARSSDDWSIEPPTGCACALCKELSAFLRDRERTHYAWPLAKERRQHIHNVIDSHGLPVTHTTIRQGRPQTLVLTKQEALFERDAALRARQKSLLTWLKKQRGAFGDAPTLARTPGPEPAR